jgi:hypothetical protein
MSNAIEMQEHTYEIINRNGSPNGVTIAKS